MTDIQFYHLLTTPLEQALPKLMARALSANMRSLVLVASDTAAERLNDALWQCDGFLPHGSCNDAHAERQPIYITHKEENPNEAEVLVVTDGSMIDGGGDFKKVLDIFDGHNPEDVAAARKRWKEYIDSGMSPTYIQQQAGGGWKQHSAAA